jgi:hypothetical protein
MRVQSAETIKTITTVRRLAVLAALSSLAVGGAIAAKEYGGWSTPVSAEAGSDPDLNTAFNDGCPILSPDGLSLYIASNRPGSQALDIWVASRQSTSQGWGKPERLPAPVNSEVDDFCPTPVRGNGLFFVSRRTEPNGDIYFTRRTESGWQTPVLLGPNINSSAQEWSPSYFEDDQGRKVLYFSSTRSGKQEIYASVNWGPAQRIAELSEGGDAARPNVRRDGREIVFDSVRAPNLGGPDVWTATRPSTDAAWSSPRHLPEVSSSTNDTRASLSWDGTIMLIGSGRAPNEGPADVFVTRRERVKGKSGEE